MNRASMLYSPPSKMSSYSTYESTQVKQRGGGVYSQKTGDWARKVMLGTMGFLAAPILSGMVGMAKKGRTKYFFKQR